VMGVNAVLRGIQTRQSGGRGVHLEPESLTALNQTKSTLNRNHCPASIRMGVRDPPESANTQEKYSVKIIYHH